MFTLDGLLSPLTALSSTFSVSNVGQSASSTFFVSTSIVALAEIGDKTQLLAFALAARYRQKWPIIFGILVATLVNHFAAAALGNVGMEWLNTVISRSVQQYLLAASFILMAGWLLIPDKIDESAISSKTGSVFITAAVAFFIAEMGDKTQIATALLAAQSNQLLIVVLGTTVGMMIANAPAVMLGDRLASRLTNPKTLQRVHQAAAAIFLVIGLLIAFSTAMSSS